MEIGKLSNELLKELVLDKIQNTNKYVKTGAGIGEDCCFVDMGSGGFVMSGDPITAAGRGAGMLAVHVTANDIAAAGGKPCCAMVTLLIPPESDMTEVETVVGTYKNNYFAYRAICDILKIAPKPVTIDEIIAELGNIRNELHQCFYSDNIEGYHFRNMKDGIIISSSDDVFRAFIEGRFEDAVQNEEGKE